MSSQGIWNFLPNLFSQTNNVPSKFFKTPKNTLLFRNTMFISPPISSAWWWRASCPESLKSLFPTIPHFSQTYMLFRLVLVKNTYFIPKISFFLKPLLVS